MIRVVRSELLKLRTTNLWWLMLIGAVLLTALALLANLTDTHFQLIEPDESELGFPPDMSEVEREQIMAEQRARYEAARTVAGLARLATNVYTSGQLFGVLLVMLLGAMIVTNEFFHQTATATFLSTPHRTVVIVGKLIAGMIMAFGFWVVTTVIDIVAGGIFFAQYENLPTSLGHWDVTRSLLLNLAAYMVWGVLGVGLGVLIRSQVAAVVTGTLLYLLSFPFAAILFGLIRQYLIKEDWVTTAQVIVPAIASNVMVTPGLAFEHAPPQWVGAVVLIGYGVLFGVIGTLVTRRRDIS